MFENEVEEIQEWGRAACSRVEEVGVRNLIRTRTYLNEELEMEPDPSSDGFIANIDNGKGLDAWATHDPDPRWRDVFSACAHELDIAHFVRAQASDFHACYADLESLDRARAMALNAIRATPIPSKRC